ncbi:CHAT domain-containing protein [Trichocoleus sp. FACHB-262]|uniref:CHAT domain-containing protein n=1 Tax=Trichocoleus sp. FACHB-262 TaxID=2692869 RepID=UPI001686D743|nr:CHAT domain-containing protein [Trichocoleus sp. FACHB-262]MBD2121524.1 CHAT domain-containing protein [Trichocoleus sp. FACHB-262]
MLCLLLSEPFLIALGQPRVRVIPSDLVEDSKVQILAQTATSPVDGKPEPRVLVAEVVVQGASGKLQEIAYQSIVTKSGQVTTRSQLHGDIDAIYKTGWFSNVKVEPEDTPTGVRVTFIVQPNPVLHLVKVVSVSENQPVLPITVVDEVFRSQYGNILNLQTLQAGIGKLNQWYRANGYILTPVSDQPTVSQDGVVTLKVAEEVLTHPFASTEDRPERVIKAEADLQRARAQKNPIAEATALRTLAEAKSDVALYQTALKLSQTSRDQAGEAEALKGLAYLYNSQAKLKTNDSNNGNNQQSIDKDKKKQAISTYQAALKIYQKLNNDTQVAIILNNIGYLFQELEDYPAAIATYRQAAPLFQKLKQPFWQALTLGHLAASYREIDEIDQSLAAHQQALLLWQFLREHPNQLQSSSLLTSVDQPGDRQSHIGASWTYSPKTGFRGDIQFYIGTDNLRKSSLADVHLLEAMSLFNVGGIYQVVGDYQQALYTFKSSLSLFQTPSLFQSLLENASATSQEDRKLLTEFIPELTDAGEAFLMSTLYADIGWQQKAQSYRDRALTKGRIVAEKTLEKIAIINKSPELKNLLPVMKSLLLSVLATASSNSSNTQFNQTLINWLNQSIPIFQQALAKRPEYKTQFQPFLPWLDVFYHYTQGEELAKANKPQQAVQAYHQALTQWKTLAPRDLQSATIQVNLFSKGTNFTDTSTIASLGIMPLVSEVFAQAQYVYHAKTYTALGKALLALGKPQESVEAHQQAVQILQGRQAPKPSRPQPANALDQFWRSLWTLFWAKIPDGATADAFFQLGKAYAANQQNASALEAYNLALPLWRKADNSLQEADTYWEMAIVQRQQGNLTEAKTHIETAIDRIESDKAQISHQQQKGSNKPVLSQKPSPYKSYLNLADYLASKHNYYGFYIDLLMQLHQQAPTAGYEKLAFQASERSHARSLRAMVNRASRPSTANSSTSPAKLQAIQLAQPLPLQDLQQQLDDKTILLEYSLGKERSYLWAVTSKTLQTYNLPKQSEIEAVSREFIELMQSPLYRVGDRRDAAPQASPNTVETDATAQLSRMLLKPVAEQLGDKRLLIVSDGILHYLPFAALPKPGTTEENQVPLLVDHEIVSLPSASMQIGLQHRANAETPMKTLAMLADPIFSREDQRLQHRSPNRTTDVETLYPRLPATRQEANQIVALVPPSKTLTKLDTAASRQIAMSPELAQYRIVHFASHGILNSQNPQRSGMVLSIVDDQGALQRSLLSTADAFNLKLSADLVVLSGCTTALGKEIQGEGLIGLTEGLMYAGAKQVVAGLWDVNDDSTALLMTHFYQGMLSQGLPPVAALRSAQIKLWQSQDWQAPYYWAAFTLQGS